MAAKALTRKDLLIALGGGVVGDMAGLRRPPITGHRTISRCLHPYWLQLIHLLAVKRPVKFKSRQNLWGAFKTADFEYLL